MSHRAPGPHAPGDDESIEGAARRARLPVARVRRYLRVGLVTPARMQGRQARFEEPQVARLRRIRRLTDDLGLDIAAIEVVLRLIDRIEALQRELDARRAADTMEVRRWP